MSAELLNMLRELDKSDRAFKKRAVQERVIPKPREELKYYNFYHFVHANGRSFVPCPLSKPYKRLTAKECFYNSREMAGDYDLVYVEGFALGHAGDPVHHAWNVQKGSNLVIDTTWGDTGTDYFGVPFNLDYVLRVGTSLIDNPEDGYPLLRKETKKKEWAYSESKQKPTT